MKGNYIINTIGWAGLIAAVLFIGLTQKCGGKAETVNNEYKTEVHNHYDSAARTIPVPVPGPRDTVRVQIPANVDTGAILRDHFTKFYYEQIIEDSSLHAVIKDTLFKNNIFSRQFSYQWKKPVTVINNTITPVPNRLYLGGEIRGNLSGVDFAPGILYQRKRVVYKASYGVLSKRYEGGIYLSPSNN